MKFYHDEIVKGSFICAKCSAKKYPFVEKDRVKEWVAGIVAGPNAKPFRAGRFLYHALKGDLDDNLETG